MIIEFPHDSTGGEVRNTNELTAIVPNNTPTTLILFLETDGEIEFVEYPIVAWVVTYGWGEEGDGRDATPITVDTVSGIPHVSCLKLPSGTCVFPGDTHLNFDEAQGYAKEILFRERKWDQKRSPANEEDDRG